MKRLLKQIEKMDYLRKQIDWTEHTGSGAYFTWKRKADALAEKMPYEYWINKDSDEVTASQIVAGRWMQAGDAVKYVEVR